MMKRERYIYQGGGDGWEGGKKDKLFHNNHRKHSPSDSPRGPRRPQRSLSLEAEPYWGAPAPDRTLVLWLGMHRLINERDTGSKYCLSVCIAFVG